MGKQLPTTPPGDRAERRKFQRIRMALDVAFGPAQSTKRQPTSDQLEHSVTVDISQGGLCFYSDVLYPVGTQISCRINLPSKEFCIAVTGPVAWFQKFKNQAHLYKIGIEIQECSKQDLSALTALLAAPPTAEASRAKTLLLADDDEELQRALKLRLETVGFHILSTNDGLDALKKGREEHPHLIILDLMLPRLDGYTVCRLLKFDPKFRDIPILILSSRSRQDDIEQAQAVGSDGYMTKPFDGKRLIENIERLLKLQGERD